MNYIIFTSEEKLQFQQTSSFTQSRKYCTKTKINLARTLLQRFEEIRLEIYTHYKVIGTSINNIFELVFASINISFLSQIPNPSLFFNF